MHQRVPEVQRLLRMTLPRWPVGVTAVESRIEDSGRKCSGSRSGMVRRRRVYSAPHGRPGSASRSCCSSGHVSGQGVLPRVGGAIGRGFATTRSRAARSAPSQRCGLGPGVTQVRELVRPGRDEGLQFPIVTMASSTPVSRTRRVRVATTYASSTSRLTDTASCESLRLKLVELGLGDRSRVEELFGRRDLIGARAATARGGD